MSAPTREVDARRVAEQQKHKPELDERHGDALHVDVHRLERRSDGEPRREHHDRRDASRIERFGDRAVHGQDHGDRDKSDDHASSASRSKASTLNPW